MTIQDEAIAFNDSVQDDLRREGLWLADIDFVKAVSNGTAPREAIAEWARQFFVAIEGLHRLAHSRPKLHTAGLDDPELKKFFWENRVEEQYGAISNTAGHLELLLQLGQALGVGRLEMVSTKPSDETRKLLEFSKTHVPNPDEYLTMQIAIGILESMNPEASLLLAQGCKEHYGLTDHDVRFYTVHITADAEHGEVAVKLLSQVPKERWDEIRRLAIDQSRLVAEMWNACLNRTMATRS